jgi:hypothetical protein
MQDMKQRPVCHRAEDLVAYLYGEAGDADARDFHNHLQTCDACRSEFASFTKVHESISQWRNEAFGLSPKTAPVPERFIATTAVTAERRPSALAAVREFFRLSPLWLRAATAVATLVFCVMAILLVIRETRPPVQIITGNNPEAKYTRNDLDQAFNKGLAQAQKDLVTQPQPKETVNHTDSEVSPSAGRRQAKPARPKGLTLEEREQLAADLRLVPVFDEDEHPFGISDQPN